MAFVKISDLPAGSSVASTDLFESSQGASAPYTSRRVTGAQVASFVRSSATDTLTTAAGTATAPAISPTGDSNTGIFFPAADTIAFAEGGAEVMRIDNAGRLNIGTATAAPAVVLTLNKATDYGGIALQVAGVTEGGITQESTGNIYIDSAATTTTGATVFRVGNTERARITSTGNLQFNSGYGSVATAFGCRAWVNFNGTGTVAIRGSGNVSSITDNGVGYYTVNFSTAMPDANYSYSHAYSSEVNVVHGVGFLNAMSASTLQVAHYDISNSANAVDKSSVLIAVYR